LEVATDFCQAWNMQLISIETKVEDDMIFDTLAKGSQFKIHQKHELLN